GKAEDLMSETDAEDRQVRFEQLARGANRIIAGLGVTGAVREEYAIGPKLEHFACARLGRHDRDAATVIGEQPQDVALDSEVICDDVQPLLRADVRAPGVLPDAALVPLIRPLGRDDPGEVHPLQPRKLAR